MSHASNQFAVNYFAQHYFFPCKHEKQMLIFIAGNEFATSDQGDSSEKVKMLSESSGVKNTLSRVES